MRKIDILLSESKKHRMLRRHDERASKKELFKMGQCISNKLIETTEPVSQIEEDGNGKLRE